MVGTKNGFVVTWLTYTNFHFGCDLMKLSAASASATAPIAGVAMTDAGTASAAAPSPARLSIRRRSMIISPRSSASMPFGSEAPGSWESTEPSFARRHDENESEPNTYRFGSPAIRLSYDEI